MSQEEIEYNFNNIKKTHWLRVFVGIAIIVGIITILSLRIFNNNNYVSINDAKLIGSKIEVKSKVSGLLGDILVANGSNVNVGQVIAKIDITDLIRKRTELETKLQEAKLNYANLKANSSVPQQINTYSQTSSVTANTAEIEKAKANKEKMEKLFSMGAISKIQYNKALEDYNSLISENTGVNTSTSQNQENNYNTTVKDTLLETASIQIRQMESALEALNFTKQFSDIVAPAGGKVNLLDVEPQKQINAGQTVMEITSDDDIYLEASIVQNDKIKIGQYVECYFNGNKNFIEGTITNIEVISDDKNRSVMQLKIVLPKDKITDYEEGQVAKIIVHL